MTPLCGVTREGRTGAEAPPPSIIRLEQLFISPYTIKKKLVRNTYSRTSSYGVTYSVDSLHLPTGLLIISRQIRQIICHRSFLPPPVTA